MQNTLRLLALLACSVSCRRHASSAPTEPPAASPPPPPAPQVPTTPAAVRVNLLTLASARVAVSSAVENASELPEHLIDGDPSTAWSSRTGELSGAWIRMRVPEGAQVRELRMIVGYARVHGAEDLFALNQRVRRVRVSHRGAVVGEFTLDTERRELQPIALSGDGGEWRVEVLETVAGTRRAWREVCVSELELWGELPGALTDAGAQIPLVEVADGAMIRSVPMADARQAVATARETLAVALAGRNPEPGTTWYGHDNMMRYFGARRALADAEVELAMAMCPITPVFSSAVVRYRGASRVEASYGDRFGSEFEPESPEGARPTTNPEGYQRKRQARDAAFEAVRGACVSAQSEVAALDAEVDEIEVAEE